MELRNGLLRTLNNAAELNSAYEPDERLRVDIYPSTNTGKNKAEEGCRQTPSGSPEESCVKVQMDGVENKGKTLKPAMLPVTIRKRE